MKQLKNILKEIFYLNYEQLRDKKREKFNKNLKTLWTCIKCIVKHNFEIDKKELEVKKERLL